MKRFYLIFVMFPLILSSLYSQWEECSNGLLEPYISCIAAKANVLYAGTKSGVFYSTDKGDNWLLLNDTLSNFWIRCIAIDDTKMIVGTSGGLFISTDGGQNFILKLTKHYGAVFKSIVISEGIIYLGIYGDYGIFLSTDNGDSWSKRGDGGIWDPRVEGISVIKDNIFVGSGINVFVSSDYGLEWSATNYLGGNISLIASDDTILWISDFSGFLISSNYGKSYIRIDPKFPPYYIPTNIILSLTLKGDTVFAGRGSNGGVILSTNYGTNWTTANEGLSNVNMVLALIVSGEYVFAGTDLGIFRAKLSEITDVEEEYIADNPLSLRPNPAGDYIEILQLSEGLKPSEGSVIKIYNTLGECVISDVRHLEDVGHLKRIDISQLPPSVYFVRIGGKVLPFVKY